MSLISILVYAVAALAVLSGLSVMIGASKTDRPRMSWFFAATLFAAIWAVSIALFLGLPPTASRGFTIAVITGVYAGGALMMLGLIGFGVWHTTIGKFFTTAALIYITAMTVLVLNDHSLMFESYLLSTSGNTVTLVNGPAYWAYAAYFLIGSAAVWVSLYRRIKRTRVKRVRQGDLVFLIGLMITGGFLGTFDVMLPLFGKYDTIWVGPLALSILFLVFYYALLKCRVVSVSSNWLQVLSKIVLTISGVVIYMLIFYLIFTALFKIPNPSPAILVLNFLMIAIVLLLMPVISEVSASIKSLISVGQVDIAYVIKKLNHLATKNVDLRELAGFLADHLHFAYIGFVINGRLYGSKALAVSSEELAQITHLKQTNYQIWQEPNKAVQKVFDELGLKAVAELRNAKGKTFGQLVVGKPMGKTGFERRDLIQLEMIINLVATVIDSEKHLRA